MMARGGRGITCNRARNRDEPETLRSRWDLDWVTPRPMDNRSTRSS
jgi:hypothetical protein